MPPSAASFTYRGATKASFAIKQAVAAAHLCSCVTDL